MAIIPASLYISGDYRRQETHPLHLSVVEINHNKEEKTLEVTCKIFRDDLEKVLAKNNKTKVDLINPANKAAMESLVNNYIFHHVRLHADGRLVPVTGIGFEYEKSEDAIYSYFQAENITSLKVLDCTNSILHELYEDQQNIIHVIVGGNRKSTKLDYPAVSASFNF
jgi:hypothetical protein